MLSFGSVLVAGAAAEVDVFAGRTIVVMAVAATKVVDGLAGEGFGGESGAGDDNLAVLVLVSGSRGLVGGHFFNGTACFVNQMASSSSLREP